jgi:hypothetical protein
MKDIKELTQSEDNQLPEDFQFGGFLTYAYELKKHNQLPQANKQRKLNIEEKSNPTPSVWKKFKERIDRDEPTSKSDGKEATVRTDTTSEDKSKREPVQGSVWKRYKAGRH